MGPLPSITSAQIESAIADVSDVQEIGRGGQKLVFSAVINGSRYALKILEAPGDDLESDETEFDAGSDLIIRARREVETMRQCKSRFMVKLGPIGLTQVEINGQPLVYFTEELVAGNDLHHGYVKQKKTLSGEEVVQLGLQMTNAIEAIWQLNKVHRDIKPGNIMRRENGDFVLLDAGLAFDKQGESLSGGWPVGTPIYFSPEQFDYASRRSVLDFRSDIFALGVSMYELATATHPFFTRGDASENIYSKIMKFSPPEPHTINHQIPEDLSRLIIRMMGKSPHLRFRKCQQLIDRLNAVELS